MVYSNDPYPVSDDSEDGDEPDSIDESQSQADAEGGDSPKDCDDESKDPDVPGMAGMRPWISDHFATILTTRGHYSTTRGSLHVSLLWNGKRETITISNRPSDYSHDKGSMMAFCLHDWCYSVLKWKVPDCTALQIFKLAESSPEILVDSFLKHGDYDRLGPLSGPALSWLSKNSSPSLLPSDMLKLPMELKDYILEQSGLVTAASAFTRVITGTSILIQSLQKPYNRVISLQPGSHLSLKTVMVFGTEYIQKIDNRKGSIVIPGTVTCVEYARSIGGICAIKFLGKHWDTGWVGHIPNASCVWYTKIPIQKPEINCFFSVSLFSEKLYNWLIWVEPVLQKHSDQF